MDKEKKKLPMLASRSPESKVQITGLPELVDAIAGMQAEIDMLNDFVDEVFILALRPSDVRYYFEDRFEGRAAEAVEVLSKHMRDYRKILEFLRVNGIDVNRIIDDNESKNLS